MGVDAIFFDYFHITEKSSLKSKKNQDFFVDNSWILINKWKNSVCTSLSHLVSEFNRIQMMKWHQTEKKWYLNGK